MPKIQKTKSKKEGKTREEQKKQAILSAIAGNKSNQLLLDDLQSDIGEEDFEEEELEEEKEKMITPAAVIPMTTDRMTITILMIVIQKTVVREGLQAMNPTMTLIKTSRKNLK